MSIEEFVDPTEEKVDHPLIGRQARVTLAWAGSPAEGAAASGDPFAEYTGPRLERDVVQTGVLVWLKAGGEAAITDEGGVTHFCWPALRIEPADLWTLIVGEYRAAEDYAFKRRLEQREWDWANERGRLSWHIAGQCRPVRLVVCHGANQDAVSSPFLAREIRRWKATGQWWGE